MSNLRNITSLEALTEVPDGTYTLVVVDGVAKLAPYGGGGGGVLFIDIDVDNGTCSKTYAEVYEAFATNGYTVLANISTPDVSLVSTAFMAAPAGIFADNAVIMFDVKFSAIMLLDDNTVTMI